MNDEVYGAEINTAIFGLQQAFFGAIHKEIDALLDRAGIPEEARRAHLGDSGWREFMRERDVVISYKPPRCTVHPDGTLHCEFVIRAGVAPAPT